MKEAKLRINHFRDRTSENGTVSAEPCKCTEAGNVSTMAEATTQPVNTSRGGRRGKWIVACLVASFVLALATFVAPATSSAQVTIGVAVSFGPPALPIYEQPPCPAPGYIWTPGYWAWDPAYGYYWVPGTWVPAPFVGALWTPGYWAWVNGMYYWYPGYWGPVVGYYGGINYGYGYTGYGYHGGYWNRGRFFYNRDVNRITNINITNVYTQRVVENNRFGHVSFNGGPGGVNVRPTAPQLAAARQRRFGAVNQQLEQERFARGDPAQRARENHGRPAVAATPRPGVFRGNGIVRARQAGAPYQEPAQRTVGRQPERAAPSQVPNGGRVERAPANNTPRNYEPNGRMERGAPAQGRVERQAPQRNAPPANRGMNQQRPEYRNNQPGAVERNQNQARPAEARRPEGRSAPERNSPPPRQENNKGGNGNGRNPGHGRR